MKQLFFLAFLIFVFSGCEDIEEPELVEIKGVQLKEMKGNVANITVEAVIENLNFFSIKVKPSTLNVYVDDSFAGTVVLNESVKLIKKSANTYVIPLTLNGEGMVLLKMVAWMAKPSLNLRLTGKVKGSVYGVSKKIDINETKVIYPEKFRSKIGL